MERLARAMGRPGTLLAAPAGTGKSILLAQWARDHDGSLSWTDLPVGAPASDPAARLADVLPEATGHPLPPAPEWFTADGTRPTPALQAALAGHPDHVAVVDDNRLVPPDPAYAALMSAAASVGDCGLRVVVATRTVPPAALAALQLRGAVALLGWDDLRFDDADVELVVRRLVGDRVLPDGLCHELSERTAGWAAGVVLAVRHWPPESVPTAESLLAAASLAIDGYVQAEILDPLAPEVRELLEVTAGLPVLSGSICDVATGRRGSGVLLRAAREHGVPLLASGYGDAWCRVHPQVRAVLAHTAGPGTRDRREVLEAAASWFADEGMFPEAAACLVDLRNWRALQELFAAHAMALFAAERLDVLVALLEGVPRHVFFKQLPWALTLATIRLLDGQVGAALSLLDGIQPLLARDDAMRADCIRLIAVGWAPDAASYITMAERALEACSELGPEHRFQDTYSASTTEHYEAVLHHGALLACAYQGDWDRARGHDLGLSGSVRHEMAQVLQAALGGQRATYLALTGDAAGAIDTATHALDLAARNGVLHQPVTAEAHGAAGEARRLAGARDAAAESLELSLELSRAFGRHNGVAIAVGALAELDVDGGAPQRALDRLDGHAAGAVQPAPPAVAARLASARARALREVGRSTEAAAAIGAVPLSGETVSMRFLLALDSGGVRAATEVLDQWTTPTPGAGLRRLLAQAALLEAAGRTADAARATRSALAVARRLDLVQPFAQFGAELSAVYDRIGRGEGQDASFVERVRVATASAQRPMASLLSRQEEQVLHHLARGRTLPETAVAIHLSVNTVKTHVKSIYRKLGVHSRSEALALWREDIAPEVGPGGVSDPGQTRTTVSPGTAR